MPNDIIALKTLYIFLEHWSVEIEPIHHYKFNPNLLFKVNSANKLDLFKLTYTYKFYDPIHQSYRLVATFYLYHHDSDSDITPLQTISNKLIKNAERIMNSFKWNALIVSSTTFLIGNNKLIHLCKLSVSSRKSHCRQILIDSQAQSSSYKFVVDFIEGGALKIFEKLE